MLTDEPNVSTTTESPQPALSESPSERRNRLRRERYAKNERQRERIQQTNLARYHTQRTEEHGATELVQTYFEQTGELPTPSMKKPVFVKRSDGTMQPVLDKDMAAWFRKLDRKVDWRKQKFWEKIAWNEATKRHPSGFTPKLLVKAVNARLFRQILDSIWGTTPSHKIQHKCPWCHKEMISLCSWRITRKDDPCDFQYINHSTLLRLQRRPDDYVVMCFGCAFDLRIKLFAWIFSPYSPRRDEPRVRRNGRPTGPYGWGPWTEEDLMQIYPKGDAALRQRIKSGAVRSLSCTISGPERTVESIIRWKPFQLEVGKLPGEVTWYPIKSVPEKSLKELKRTLSITQQNDSGKPESAFLPA